jgi:rfaE bifunctional protein nucleotidyltransferase chain/domain
MRYRYGVVGLGRVGGAMLALLREAGHIPAWVVSSKKAGGEVVSHEAIPEQPGDAQVVFIAVPDGRIREVADRMGQVWGVQCRSVVFLHLSGLLTSGELSALQDEGAEVGSLHPLQSITDAEQARQILRGSVFTFEGSEGAREVARHITESLGVPMMTIAREDKVLYHASAVVASNYLVALMDQAASIIREVGLDQRHLMPLVRGTLANIEKQGCKALTGPVARGDWVTVQAHVRALSARFPDMVSSYLELGRYTARLAGRQFPEEKVKSPGPVDLGELCDALAIKKARGMKVVFTNGCFDIIHAGHVMYLAKARAMGDCLVVGLNADSSVRRIKGPERPINQEHARAAVLGALASVDHVVLFEEDTPLNLIECMRPDVLVKGGDWAVEDIVGADVVRSSGGQVITIPFEDGFSTTGIIRRIKQD